MKVHMQGGQNNSQCSCRWVPFHSRVCLHLIADIVQCARIVAPANSVIGGDNTRLEGQSPQIYTVSHVWTFEFQFFLSFGYATFPYFIKIASETQFLFTNNNH